MFGNIISICRFLCQLTYFSCPQTPWCGVVWYGVAKSETADYANCLLNFNKLSLCVCYIGNLYTHSHTPTCMCTSHCFMWGMMLNTIGWSLLPEVDHPNNLSNFKYYYISSQIFQSVSFPSGWKWKTHVHFVLCVLCTFLVFLRICLFVCHSI